MILVRDWARNMNPCTDLLMGLVSLGHGLLLVRDAGGAPNPRHLRPPKAPALRQERSPPLPPRIPPSILAHSSREAGPPLVRSANG